MGVAVDELAAHPVGHLIEIKVSRVLLNGGMEHHLEQHVAQLLFQMLHRALVNGLGHLVGLLQEVAADGLMGLLPVPLTAAGSAEDFDDPDQIL